MGERLCRGRIIPAKTGRRTSIDALLRDIPLAFGNTNFGVDCVAFKPDLSPIIQNSICECVRKVMRTVGVEKAGQKRMPLSPHEVRDLPAQSEVARRCLMSRHLAEARRHADQESEAYALPLRRAGPKSGPFKAVSCAFLIGPAMAV